MGVAQTGIQPKSWVDCVKGRDPPPALARLLSSPQTLSARVTFLPCAARQFHRPKNVLREKGGERACHTSCEPLEPYAWGLCPQRWGLWRLLGSCSGTHTATTGLGKERSGNSCHTLELIEGKSKFLSRLWLAIPT